MNAGEATEAGTVVLICNRCFRRVRTDLDPHEAISWLLMREAECGCGAPRGDMRLRIGPVVTTWSWVTDPSRSCSYLSPHGFSCSTPVHKGRGWWVVFCEAHHARLNASTRVRLFDTYRHPLPPGPNAWGAAWIDALAELQDYDDRKRIET